MKQRATLAARILVGALLAAVAIHDPDPASPSEAAQSFRPPRGGGLLDPGDAVVAAVTLEDGRVLVLESAGTPEIFDPDDESFAATGHMLTPRTRYQATRLADGRVLISGGVEAGDPTATLASTEIYDPGEGRFEPGPRMNRARAAHTATRLADGRVLVAGGTFRGGATPRQLDAAEVFDPDSESFTSVASMTEARAWHAAASLEGGGALLAGGLDPGSSGGGARSSAEVFDPEKGTFTAVGDMGASRSNLELTRLDDGRVLVSGGQSSLALAASLEVFDPATGAFETAGDLFVARSGHTATRLEDGRVLLAGGRLQRSPGEGLAITGTALLWDPATGDASPTATPMRAPRSGAVATRLADGGVLIVGGTRKPNLQPSAELFIPGDGGS